MDDFLELGLEAFDRITDRYHDPIYDKVVTVGPKLKPKFGGKGKVVQQNGAEMSGAIPRGQPENSSRNRRDNRAPDIRVDGPRDGPDHIYPPAPQPTVTPYPTTAGPGNGQLIPMPPDGQYPLQRRLSNGQYREIRRDVGYYSSGDEDDDRRRGDGELRRSRSDAGSRRKHHRRRRHHHSREEDQERSDKFDDRNRSKGKGHMTATISGAIAGGLVGNEATKGNLMATLAGAVVGGIGANAAERGWDKYKRKESKNDDRWDDKWASRS